MSSIRSTSHASAGPYLQGGKHGKVDLLLKVVLGALGLALQQATLRLGSLQAGSTQQNEAQLSCTVQLTMHRDQQGSHPQTCEGLCNARPTPTSTDSTAQHIFNMVDFPGGRHSFH